MRNGIIIKISAGTPSLWLLTDKVPGNNASLIKQENIIFQFEKRKASFGTQESDVQLGRKGEIEIGYEEMELISCKNSGKQATVTYRMKLKSSLPNVILTKTYRIPADKTAVYVDISLKNATEQGVRLSYWSHNVFGNVAPKSRVFLVQKSSGIELLNYNQAKKKAYSSRKNADAIIDNDIMKKARKNYADNGFGEYYSDEKIGVAFTLPDDFMQIYRWAGHGKASMEWMSMPQDIASGDSYTTSYAMRIFSAPDAETFAKHIKADIATIRPVASSEEKSGDFTFKLKFKDENGDGLPDNFDQKKISEGAKVSLDKSNGALVFNCPNANGNISIQLKNSNAIKLPADGKYILSFRFKIEEMKVTKKWPKGFVVYLFGAAKKYKFIGSTCLA